jgi:hypothetical protein
VTLQIGLGIGCLVFRALNTVEVGFAVVLLAAVPTVGAGGRTSVWVVVAFSVVFAVLAIQLIAVRPRLTRRSDEVLAGADGPRSLGHYVYIGLEAAKVVALSTAGILLLTG